MKPASGVQNNIKEPVTPLGKKSKRLIESWFGYLAIGLMSASYILFGLLDFNLKDSNPFEIIASTAFTLVVGMTINKFFRLQAEINYMQDPDLVNDEIEHSEKVKKAEPLFRYGDRWSNVQNETALKNARVFKLASIGVSYTSCFDKENSFIGHSMIKTTKGLKGQDLKRQKRANKVIKEASTISLTPLTLTALTSISSKFLDPYNLGRDKEVFESLQVKKDLSSKVVVALVFGMFGLGFVQDPSWDMVIASSMQVALFLVTGLISYYVKMSFLLGEYKNSVKEKSKLIDRFIQWAIEKQQEEVNLNGNTNKDNTNENSTTTGGGTQENYSIKFSPIHNGGSTIGSTTTPSVSGADEKAVD